MPLRAVAYTPLHSYKFSHVFYNIYMTDYEVVVDSLTLISRKIMMEIFGKFRSFSVIFTVFLAKKQGC